MRKVHFRAILLVLIIGVLIITSIASISGCGNGGSSSVEIGAVLPLSGDISEYGNRCKKGIELAVDDINGDGGIKGRKVEIIFEDTQGRPQDGVSAARKLIDIQKVKFIIGAVSSSVTLAIEPITTKNKVVLFSPASSSPKLTGISEFFFRDWPSDVFEATALSKFAYDSLGLRNVAILYCNTDYGIGLKNEFQRNFESLGGRIPIIETYDQGSNDFRTQLAKIKSHNIDGIYLAGYHIEMANATKQIREMGIDVQILGDGDYGVEELLKIAGNAAEGAIYSIPEYDPNKGSKKALEFSKEFQARFGSLPSIFEANAYDAVMIIAEAIDNVGYNAEKASHYIAGIKGYDGASGNISFDDRGEVVKPISIKIVKDGKFILY